MVAPAIQSVVVVCMLISTISLTFLAVEFRRIRCELVKDQRRSRPACPEDYLPSAVASIDTFQEVGVMGARGGYAIYVCRRGVWELDSDLSAPGYEPSAPTIPGTYELQVIKKESRLASSSSAAYVTPGGGEKRLRISPAKAAAVR